MSQFDFSSYFCTAFSTWKSNAKIVKYFDMKQENRENISEIKRRILQYIENIGITREEFYNKVSLNGANFRGKSALSELSGDKIANILRSYQDLNPDWLLLGKGEMLRVSSPEIPSDTTLSALLDRISDLAQELGRAQAENAELKKELALAEEKMAASATAAAG